MKILYISPDPNMNLSDTRGYSIHMTELINAFRQIGNTVIPVIAGQSTTNNNTKSSAKKSIRNFLPGRIIETARSFKDVFNDYKLYYKAKAALLDSSPDFIYERYAVLHQSGVILSKKHRVPIILEVNAPISERDMHYGPRRRTLIRKIEKRILTSADAIVVVSTVLKEHFIEMGVEDSRIHVIPNAVDCDKFNLDIDGEQIKKKYGIKDKIVIGFVGSFMKWHGINSLLLAASDIVAKIKNVHFLLVGDGRMYESANRFIKVNSLTEHVTLPGSVPYKNIPQYVAAMDITSMPNSNSYGSPIKIFEYMAMGKTIIAPKVGPVEEVIDHGKEGLLIEPGDKNELRDAMLFLCENEEVRNQMAKNARQKVLKKHTWNINAERIIQLFSMLK